jgi:hypothetical protein
LFKGLNRLTDNIIWVLLRDVDLVKRKGMSLWVEFGKFVFENFRKKKQQKT